MKKIIIVALFGVMAVSSTAVILPADAINTQTEQDKRGYVTVSYTAEKEVAPDTVEVSISVKTDDKKSMQVATQENKEISDKIYAYLKGMITPANGDYIKTSNFSARPNYIYNSGKRSFDKYEVSNNIIVHTKSIDKISTMIDKSLTLGATDIDSLNFSLSEKDAQCADLLSNATKQARKRADIIAAAAGSSVAGIKTIDTSCTVNRYGNVNYTRNSLMMKAAGSVMEDGATTEAAPTQIEAGVIKIYSNINAAFYLK